MAGSRNWLRVVIVVSVLVALLLGALVASFVRVEVRSEMTFQRLDWSLINAMKNGESLESIRARLDADPSLVSSFRLGGRSLLSWAIDANRADVVELLLDRGADPDGRTIGAEDPYIGAPLLNAVAVENPRIVQMLVDRGASLDVKDGFGRDPLQMGEDPPCVNEEVLQILRAAMGRAGPTTRSTTANGTR